MNKLSEDPENLEQKIIIELLTHFVYKLQTLLDIKISPSEEYSFIPIDQMNINQLRKRLHQIESKVTQITQNSTFKKPSINILLNELNEENDIVSQEINLLKNDL